AGQSGESQRDQISPFHPLHNHRTCYARLLQRCRNRTYVFLITEEPDVDAAWYWLLAAGKAFCLRQLEFENVLHIEQRFYELPGGQFEKFAFNAHSLRELELAFLCRGFFN